MSSDRSLIIVDEVERRFAPAPVRSNTSTPSTGLSDYQLVFRQVNLTSGEVSAGPEEPNDPESVVSIPRLVVHSLATFVVVFLAGLAAMATVPRTMGLRPVVVVSGSMLPAIAQGDVVITAPVDPAGLGIGSVANFTRRGESFLHRIVAVTAAGYRTKGDANPVADPELLDPSDVDGVGVVVVPVVGWPAVWADHERWYEVALTLVASAGAIHLARPSWLHRDTAP